MAKAKTRKTLRSSSSRQKSSNSYTATILVPKRLNLNYVRLLGKTKTYSRGSVRTSETAKQLRVFISASDPTALRASINMVLRDLQVIEAVRSIANADATNYRAARAR